MVDPMTQVEKTAGMFLPVTIGRASEEIVLQVEAAILDGRLAPGERLPSESSSARAAA